MKYFKFFLPVLALFLIVTGPAFAKDPVYTGTFNNNAVGGYDTVSYFTEGQAVKGSKDFQTEYKGANWRFSSAENLALFEANPEKYAPQYGGYCAFGLAQGSFVSSDPEVFKIVDDKLYLNYNKAVQGRWEENIPGYIVDANATYSSKVE